MKRIALILASLLALAASAATMHIKSTTPITPTAVLSWTAPTLRTDGTPITGSLNYNIYQGPSGAEVKVPALTTAATTETVSLPNASGTTVCFVATAVETGGLESAPTNEVCKTFPAAAPLSPATLTIK